MKRGRTSTWRNVHGLSLDAIEGVPARAMVSASEDCAAESEGASEGRWARFPSRCIWSETSFESYVHVDHACAWGSALCGRANEGHGEGKRSMGAGIFGTAPGADQWMERESS